MDLIKEFISRFKIEWPISDFKRASTSKSSLIPLYRDSHLIIMKFLRSVVGRVDNNLKAGKLYFDILQDSSEDVLREIEAKKVIFMYELRKEVLSKMKNADQADKKILEYLLSLFHLIQLVKTKGLSSREIMNTWLNVNYKNKYDIRLHAIRGNFNEIIKINPSLKCFISELRVIEKEFSEYKLTDEQYECLKDKWYQKHKMCIPKDIVDIFMRKDSGGSYDWSENLCYRLTYKSRRDATFCSDTLQKCNGSRFEEIIPILRNDYEELLKNSGSWLRVILNLVYGPTKRYLFYGPLFGFCDWLFTRCWKTSLLYYSFTIYNRQYFDQACDFSDLEMADYEFLLDLSKKIDAPIQKLLKKYQDHLLCKKEYGRLTALISENNSFKYRIDSGYINFCLHYDRKLKKVFRGEFSKSNVGKFLYSYKRYVNKDRMMRDEDLDNLFESTEYQKKVLDKLAADNRLCDTLILKILKFLSMSKEEGMCGYKKVFTKRLHDVY